MDTQKWNSRIPGIKLPLVEKADGRRKNPSLKIGGLMGKCADWRGLWTRPGLEEEECSPHEIWLPTERFYAKISSNTEDDKSSCSFLSMQ